MKQRKCLNIVLKLSIIEGILSVLATWLIPSDPKNALVFGLSLSRIVILLFSFAIITLLIYFLLKPTSLLNLSTELSESTRLVYFLTFAIFFSFFLLWMTIWLPVEYLGKFQASFVRLKPLVIWLELLFFQLTLFYKIFTQSFSRITKQSLSEKKSFQVFLISLISVWLFISTTKIGLVKDTAFWNVAGVPVSGIQLSFTILFIMIYWFIVYWPGKSVKKQTNKYAYILIPLLIYLIAIAIWGFTPMLKHYFSLEPTAPNFQPYPFSDARHHDYGAISILRGQGIFFKGYTDKPLYMTFLSVLHLIAQQDYVKLTWLHVIALGLIPVMIYFLGKRYHSQLLGLVLALLIIFQQRNAILLSYVIASANPKLFVTEVVMLLGMLLLAFLAFKWIKTEDKKLALLLGGTIGALSLIRINPVFMLPLMAVIGFFLLRKKWKILTQQMMLLLVGFMLVFSPWIISGVNPQGESWFIIKIMDVLNTRYSKEDQTYNINEFKSTTSPRDEVQLTIGNDKTTFNGHLKVVPQIDVKQIYSPDQANYSSLSQNFSLMTNHFLHNISTSFLILPDSLKILNSKDISLEPYRMEGIGWNGNFTIEQQALIIVNLIILSIGLSESWAKHRWAGLVPLLIFLTYNISLSFAMNSGSRYIVPINWAIYFYFATGLLYLAKILFNTFKIIPLVKDKSDGEQYSPNKHLKIKLVVIFSGLVVLASIVPVSNLVVPHFVQPTKVLVELNSLYLAGDSVHMGTIFYPYYTTDGKFIKFDFLEADQIQTYQIDRQLLVDQNTILQTNTPVILGLKQNGELQEVSDLFLVKGNEALLIWQNSEKNDFVN